MTVNFTVNRPVGDTRAPFGAVTVRATTGESCRGSAPSDSCPLAFSTYGTRTVTASYAGDANFLGSTSAGVSQPVGDFQTSVSPTSQTIVLVPGHQLSAGYTVSLTSLGSFTGSVALSCSFTGGPCSLSPSTVTLNSGATASATATVTVVQVGGANPRGTYTVTVRGTYGTTSSRSGTATLTVQ